MREVTQHVAEVETGHCNLGDYHLEESTESREDTEFVLVKTKTCSGTEVSALHNCRMSVLDGHKDSTLIRRTAGWNENFGVLLMNTFQPGGTLQIAYMKWLEDLGYHPR